MTAVTPGQADEPEIPVRLVRLWLCDLCLDGAGGECHTPGCALWINRAPDLPLRGNPMVTIPECDDSGENCPAHSDLPYAAAAQPAPGGSEAAYLYHWRFDRGEEFGLYWHRAGAESKAAEHAGDGLSEVLSMAILGERPEQPAPETAGALGVAVQALRGIAYGAVVVDGLARPLDPSVRADKALAAIRDLQAAAPAAPQPAPELAQVREQVRHLRGLVTAIAEGLEQRASLNRPSKVSEICGNVAAALRKALEG